MSIGSFPSLGSLHGTINHDPAVALDSNHIIEQGAFSDDGLEDDSIEILASDNDTSEEDQENKGSDDLAVSEYVSEY